MKQFLLAIRKLFCHHRWQGNFQYASAVHLICRDCGAEEWVS